MEDHLTQKIMFKKVNPVEEYFSKHWKPDWNKFTHSGWQLVDKINALNPESVLDVGCGFNDLKGKIPGLYGIDPYNDKADEKVSIENFNCGTKEWDVVLALGSINFGSEFKIRRQFRKSVGHLKNGGHFFGRFNPGSRIGHNEHAEGIDFFPWSKSYLKDLCYEYALSTVQIEKDNERIFFHGIKDFGRI